MIGFCVWFVYFLGYDEFILGYIVYCYFYFECFVVYLMEEDYCFCVLLLMYVYV